MSTRIKWSYETIIEKLKEIHGDKYDYSNFKFYENMWQKIEVKCKIHNITFEPYISNHLKKGTGCPECGNIKRKSTKQNMDPIINFETVHERFKKVHGDKYEYFPETYKGTAKKMKMYCKEHDFEFWQHPSNHSQGKRCPKCGHDSMVNKLRFTNEELKDALSSVHNYEYDESTYVSTKKPMKFICQLHGEFWQKPMNQLRMWAGCPICSTTKSEKELLNLFPNFKHRDRKLINPLEIDLIDYEYKFGVEFNGNIWHSFGKTFPNNSLNVIKSKHQDKTNLVEQEGFQLFHILDIDWENPIRKEIWKSIINSKLGKTERIYARNTKIIDLSTNRGIVKSFLINNHLQGFGNYKYAYGLVNKFNQLLAIMTFGKPVEDSSNWEIKRFCNMRNYTIVGGASKLLKYFERLHNPESILSYAKRDWSKGELYEKLGFSFISEIEPSKFYIKNNIKYSRQKFQKHKLQDRLKDGLLDHLDGVTTEEILFNNGYRVFYDSGNLKYIKYYNKKDSK